MNTIRRIITTALLAAVAFLTPLLTMVPAHADAFMNAYANSQRAAAGVGALKSNAAMAAQAQAAAERYAASNDKSQVGSPEAGIPSGWNGRGNVSGRGVSLEDAYANAANSTADNPERMNRGSWTDIGSGVARNGNQVYTVIVYATYPPPPAPAPAPAPVVPAPAPAPPAAPAPAPVIPEPVVEAPPAPPAPAPEPVVEAPAAPAQAATPEPAPTASATPSATATPSPAPSPSETATAAPVMEQKVEQASAQTESHKAVPETIRNGSFWLGCAALVLAVLAGVKRLSLRPRTAE